MGGAKLASCPGRHLTSLRPLITLGQGWWANYGPRDHFMRPVGTCRNS